MIGTGQNKRKKIDIYLDGSFKSKARSGLSGNTIWNFDVLKENSKGYQVYVKNATNGSKGSIFNPRTFWLLKSDLSVKLNTVKKPSNIVGLNTGDIMVVSDKDGKKLGEWTFKKY